jgi:hypothetical protein
LNDGRAVSDLAAQARRDLLEAFNERAAIIEYDGRRGRALAEALAMSSICAYKVTIAHRDMSVVRGPHVAIVIDPGQEPESFRQDMIKQWGDRLISIESLTRQDVEDAVSQARLDQEGT